MNFNATLEIQSFFITHLKRKVASMYFIELVLKIKIDLEKISAYYYSKNIC